MFIFDVIFDQGGSDVYLFLDHEAEDPVSVVIDRLGGTSLPATLIDTAVYTFTLPGENSRLIMKHYMVRMT